MAVTTVQEDEYDTLISELVAFRAEHLRGQPSVRTLARAAAVSPQTIGNWLQPSQPVFPQSIEPLLKTLRVMELQAEQHDLTKDPMVAALLDQRRWQRAYEAKARQRAMFTSKAVVAGQGKAILERLQPGRPLAQVIDPFDLEVKHAIKTPIAGLPVLPMYVPRAHDQELANVVRRAADGTSQIAVLVGGSSTGKTRACWEALGLLRARGEPWRLWHPIDPTRPDAALDDLPNLTPYTVVWLNDAAFYLDGPLGERVAAGLRSLLRDPSRGPVLVLATLWSEDWDDLTTKNKPDVHAQARELLYGHKIRVPDAFVGDDLSALSRIAGDDPRLDEAIKLGRGGQVTQYLAGVPVLMDRYHQAPPATKAFVRAAMDARNLGVGPHIPLALLAGAAPGYLSDTEWDQTGDDWLQQALEYVSKPCNGIPGILTCVKTSIPRNRRQAVTSRVQVDQGPVYRLADCLDQHGRRYRTGQIPPVDFWTAAVHSHPADLTTLGNAALRRGLYRDAAQLHKNATALGSPTAACKLVALLHGLHPGDPRPGQWAVTRVALDELPVVASLLHMLWQTSAHEQLVALAERIVAEASLDSPTDVVELVFWLLRSPADEQLDALARVAVVNVSLDRPFAVSRLLDSLREAGAREQMVALAERAVTEMSLDSPTDAAGLLDSLREAGAREQMVALAERATTEASLDDPTAVAALVHSLRQASAHEQILALAHRAVAEVALTDAHAVADLIETLQEVGAGQQVTELAQRAATTLVVHYPSQLTRLLNSLRRAAAHEHVSALVEQAVTKVSLEHPHTAALFVGSLRWVASDEQMGVLVQRAVSEVSLDYPHAVAVLVDSLRQVASEEQMEVLVQRVVAGVSFDDPYGVAHLVHILRRVASEEQMGVLVQRAISEVSVDIPTEVAMLLNSLRAAEAHQQVAQLAKRAVIETLVNHPHGVARLIHILRRLASHEQVVLLAQRAVSEVSLDDPSDVAVLLNSLRVADAHQEVVDLARRAVSRSRLEDPSATALLVHALREAKADQQAVILIQRAVSEVPLTHPIGTARLVDSLRLVHAHKEAVQLAERAVKEVSIDGLSDVGILVNSLRRAGAHTQIAALAERVAAEGSLDNPSAVARMVNALRRTKARQQMLRLAKRAAAETFLGDAYAVDHLIRSLERSHAHQQVAMLVERLPAAGCFPQFVELRDPSGKFRFGREPDGCAADPWSWEDLQ
ncbi:hypothetical protein ABT373_37350 [Streptomyces sp. NPDC000070]|uniref:hypothetical protein n=1 Tax=Streptomyces sp. NPDC000070 TaxID=3154240 RepID=UPI0033334CEA